MSEFFIQVSAMIIGTIILGWMGFGGGNHKVTIQNGKHSTKKWKVVILVGILMIVSGLSLFANHFPGQGFNDPYSGLGFSLAFIGIFVLLIGRFGRWWSKD